MRDPLLSILTLTIPSRVREFFPNLVDQLQKQVGHDQRVEVLGLFDNQRNSIGRKWNALVEMARGRYITAVGDDDLVSEDYVETLLEAIEGNVGVDCISFDTKMYVDGEFAADVIWGRDQAHRDDWPNKKLYRAPGELMCVRSDIRKKHLYPDIWRGSDWRQAREMRQDIETEIKLDKFLYYYYFRSDNNEHISHQKIANRRRRLHGLAQRNAKKRA